RHRTPMRTRVSAARRPARPASLPFSFAGPPPTAFYTLSLHDALPISVQGAVGDDARSHAGAEEHDGGVARAASAAEPHLGLAERDQKSTRLNSSHDQISYAVFCLKKKKETHDRHKFRDMYAAGRVTPA